MRRALPSLVCLVAVSRTAAAHPPPPPPPLLPPILVPAPELDGRLAISAGIGLGGIELSDTGGILSPDLRASVAWVTAPFELVANAEWSGWGDLRGDDGDPGLPRRFARLGTTVRWDFALPEHANPDVAMLAYTEAGMGWEHVSSARAAADRGDVHAGVGLEELFLRGGHARYGFDLSLRVLGAPATDAFARVACHAVCPPTGRGVDLGITIDVGLVLRR